MFSYTPLLSMLADGAGMHLCVTDRFPVAVVLMAFEGR